MRTPSDPAPLTEEDSVLLWTAQPPADDPPPPPPGLRLALVAAGITLAVSALIAGALALVRYFWPADRGPTVTRPRRRAARRPTLPEAYDAMHATARAVNELQALARDLRQARADRTAARVRSALSSAYGAHRHAVNRYIRARDRAKGETVPVMVRAGSIVLGTLYAYDTRVEYSPHFAHHLCAEGIAWLIDPRQEQEGVRSCLSS
jgi:hypothetical protein